MFAQNRFGWQVIGAAAATTPATTSRLVEQVAFAGRRRSRSGSGRRSAGKRQVGWHFVTDDPHAF